MKLLYCDIETYSDIDLKKTNVYRYVESPEFRILMAGWSWGEHAWLTEDEEATRAAIETALADPEVAIVAHNAAFERVCFSAYLGMPVGEYLPPQRFIDTQAIAAEWGYPSKLEPLAEALGGEQKDSAGTRLINIFSKPNRKGLRTLPEEKPEEWEQFKAYCIQDVVTLVDVHHLLGDFPSPAERSAYHADQLINDRGLRIDLELARCAVEASEDNRMLQELEFMSITGVANPGSQPQVLKWCQSEISPRIKNLQKETVSRLLSKPALQPHHRRALELRQELALVASKKFSAALATVNSDGRLRGTLAFFGAHTGRWAGRGTQLQNLPREAFTKVDPVTGKEEWDGEAEAAAIFDLKAGFGASSLDLKKLVRSLFVVNGVVVDYSSIEARIIAGLAGEQWAMDAFAQGRDIYVETAERMSTPDRPLTRSHGKVAVLALGYQGAVNSLRNMGAEGTDEELAVLVKQWRQANPNIVRLWRALQEALYEGGEHQIGKYLRTSWEGETFRIHLPSGRAISYHGMRWERYRIQDPEQPGRWIRKEGFRYDDPKKKGFRIGTYGGRLAENVTQATARDLLAPALVRLEKRGFRTVGHVHDEAIVENTQDVSEVVRIMCHRPPWAREFPIDGEGFWTARYRKG